MPTLHVFFINTLLNLETVHLLKPSPTVRYNLPHIVSWLLKETTTSRSGYSMITERVAVVFSHSHDADFASWHLCTCQNALWLLQNIHHAKFRVVAVFIFPERVVVFFSGQEAISQIERSISTVFALNLGCFLRRCIVTFL